MQLICVVNTNIKRLTIKRKDNRTEDIETVVFVPQHTAAANLRITALSAAL